MRPLSSKLSSPRWASSREMGRGVNCGEEEFTVCYRPWSSVATASIKGRREGNHGSS